MIDPIAQAKSNTPEAIKDSWRTPLWLFNLAQRTLPGRIFSLDVAASKNNALCDRFFTKKDNGLERSWYTSSTEAAFCNPPYSETGKWIEKAAHEWRCNNSSALVVQTPNGEMYWKTVFDYASSITFIHGRVSFIHPENSLAVYSKTHGTCIVTFDAYSNRTDTGRPIDVFHVECDEAIES